MLHTCVLMGLLLAPLAAAEDLPKKTTLSDSKARYQVSRKAYAILKRGDRGGDRR
jgi:hypothetical protein